MADLRDSVVLITSQDSQRIEDGKFGTGFLIHREQETTYILTCAHVVTDVGGREYVKVAGHKATVEALGDIKGCDLAVLSVKDESIKERWTNLSLLKLRAVGEVGMDFDIMGSYTDKTKTYKQAPIKGKLGEIESIVTPDGDRTKAWGLRINEDSTQQLQPGYSGSPVFAKDTDYILGVVAQLTGTNQGVAISIEALKKVWQEMPPGLISSVTKTSLGTQTQSYDSFYKKIIDAFKKGIHQSNYSGVIPFLGAGVNLGASSSINLIEIATRLAEELEISNPEDLIGETCSGCPKPPILEQVETTNRQSIDSKPCPLYNEQMFAKAKTNLCLLSQYYRLKNKEDNSEELYNTIHQLFPKREVNSAENENKSHQVYQFLATLPKKLYRKGYEKLPYQLILTTNYDEELEQSFQQAGQPFDLIYYLAEGQKDRCGRFVHKTHEEICAGKEGTIITGSDYSRELPWNKHPIILKLYGTWKDKFVITEDHHINYLSYDCVSNLLPAKLLQVLSQSKNRILLLGYSLYDSDLEKIFNRFSEDKQEMDITKGNFSIVYESKPSKMGEYAWQRRGLIKDEEFIKSPLKDCINNLEKGIKNLKDVEMGNYA